MSFYALTVVRGYGNAARAMVLDRRHKWGLLNWRREVCQRWTAELLSWNNPLNENFLIIGAKCYDCELRESLTIFPIKNYTNYCSISTTNTNVISIRWLSISSVLNLLHSFDYFRPNCNFLTLTKYLEFVLNVEKLLLVWMISVFNFISYILLKYYKRVLFIKIGARLKYYKNSTIVVGSNDMFADGWINFMTWLIAIRLLFGELWNLLFRVYEVGISSVNFYKKKKKTKEKANGIGVSTIWLSTFVQLKFSTLQKKKLSPNKNIKSLTSALREIFHWFFSRIWLSTICSCLSTQTFQLIRLKKKNK